MASIEESDDGRFGRSTSRCTRPGCWCRWPHGASWPPNAFALLEGVEFW